MPQRPSRLARTPLTLASLVALGCSASPPAAPVEAVHRAPPPVLAPGAPLFPTLPRGHTALGEALGEHVPFTLHSIPGGRAALLVSQRAEDRVAWARRIDERGALGPLHRFLDQRIVGALDRDDGASTLLTSDGARLCLTSAAWRDSASCTSSTPSEIVPVGDRVALLELSVTHAPEPAKRAPRKAAPARARPSKAKVAKKKKPTRVVHPRPPSHPRVELLVRWVDAHGAIDAEASPTGLRFEAPLDGMTLAGARARPPGIDVMWFEAARRRRTRAPLGSGSLVVGSLRADGSYDPSSRAVVLDADVEYGKLKDHNAPRLVGNDVASVYLGVDAKGRCEAIRVRPSLARLTPPAAACSVAPEGLAGALDPAVYDRILADEPRRAFGQPKTDLGLAVWAGSRAYYLHGGELRSAARSEEPPRAVPPPFAAHRARIAWGAAAPDGEAVAFVNGGVVHIDARGAVQRSSGSGAVKPGLLGLPELPGDRRRAARIGASWWLARGERLRVWPDVAPALEAGHHPDTSVLVGGRELGLSLDLVGSALRISSVSPSGEAARLAFFPAAPVRVGFDACERGGGGAIVAGVSAVNPAHLVAFAIDTRGDLGPIHRVALPSRPGELAVRVTPLPSGGALVTDLTRLHVAWLDDDAAPLATAAMPAEESDVSCVDGRPMRLVVPGPSPGQKIAVPGVAGGSCIVGDPLFSSDGDLRWLGASVTGLDSYAEVVSLPLVAPVAALVPVSARPLASRPSPAVEPPRRCPPDMVLVASRFCVDRFESMLVDARTAEVLSPDYPATPNLLGFVLSEWATGRERVGDVHARAFPLPWLSPARLGDKPEPVAVARMGVRPSGYLTGLVGAAACAAAGKRLCRLDEFVTACRGEDDTPFPYGDTYRDGVCNVFREEHPAALLHDNASVGHLDPRLNRVSARGRPLLQQTGESPGCRSAWGDDAIYDMVGNLDEWVDEGNGAFAGGFYSRSTRSGCEALVTNHPRSYLDYSTGVRCCRDPQSP